MKKQLAVIVCTVLLSVFTGCSVFAGKDAKVELTGLVVSQTVATLTPGQTETVIPDMIFSKEEPSDEEIAELLERTSLIWNSSDDKVAKVEAGRITAVAAGTATIEVADSEKLFSACINVVVIVPADTVDVTENITLDLLAGETGKLEPKIMPANATNLEIVYSSKNETVVTVDENGGVTPVSAGEADIVTTVKSDSVNGRIEKTYISKVAVRLLPQGIGIANTEGILLVGHTFQLLPYCLPEEAPETTYSFESGNTAVATVDESGNMKAVAAGTAVITITSAEGHSVEYTLTVKNAPAPRPAPAAPEQGGDASNTPAPPKAYAGSKVSTDAEIISYYSQKYPTARNITVERAEKIYIIISFGDPAYPPGSHENPLPLVIVEVGEEDLQDTDGLA